MQQCRPRAFLDRDPEEMSMQALQESPRAQGLQEQPTVLPGREPGAGRRDADDDLFGCTVVNHRVAGQECQRLECPTMPRNQMVAPTERAGNYLQLDLINLSSISESTQARICVCAVAASPKNLVTRLTTSS